MLGRCSTIAVGLLLLALPGVTIAQGLAGERADVSVTLTPHNPPIIIPNEGGNFAYRAETANGEAASHAFDLWTTYAVLGGGDEPGYGPVDLLLPEGWSAYDDRVQTIPGDMPEGQYTYSAHVGIYPGEIWSSDSFEFEKLPGQAGWYRQSPGAENGLSGVSFVDAEHGWAVSTYREILHTVDGGDIWEQQDDGQYYPHQYNDVHFVDTETGWVVGHGWSLGGTILHTTDAGMTWVEQEPDSDYEFMKVYFVDALHGWAVGGFVDLYGSNHRRVIEHTSDGGDTWEGQHWQSYRYPLVSVHFADVSNGWAVGGPGYILHTTNGGGTWVEQNSGTTSYLQDVCFVDANIGWCVGDDGLLLHTTDGGDHWQAQSAGMSAEFRSVFFADAATGWIAGVDYSALLPVILYTEDAGANWEAQDPGTGSDLVVLKDICFVDVNHGWVAGQLWPDVGVMLHTENGGKELSGIDDHDLGAAEMERAEVSAPSPNPLSTNTWIRFAVPGERSQPVIVAIYDPQGRRIRSLIDEPRNPGEHSVVWDGLTDRGEPVPSGVYVYGITIGDFATSGKLAMLR